MRYIFSYLSLLWQYSKAKTVYLFILTALSSLTEGIGIFLLVPLLGVLQKPASELGGIGRRVLEVFDFLRIPQTVTGLILTFLILVVFRNILNYFKTVASNKIQMDLVDNLRLRGFKAMLGANWKWVSSLKKSDNTNVLLNELDRISEGLNLSIMMMIMIITLSVNIVIALSFSFVVTCIAILMASVIISLLRFQRHKSIELGETLNRAQSDMQQVVEEGFTGLKLTKILGSEARHIRVMDAILSNKRSQVLDYSKTQRLADALFHILISALLAALLWAGIEVFEVPMATLLVLVVILARMGPNIRLLQSFNNQLVYAWPALRNFDELMEKAAEVNEPEPLSSVSWIFDQTMSLNDVSFCYHERDTQSLNNVSLIIKAHETTAIIGPSGAGKSTLADMLMGLLAPEMGDIRIDGTLMDTNNRTSWRSHVAYVPQDVFLFHDTIKNNLLWAAPDASQEELESALKKSAAEFVFDLQDGLNTMVGDGGLRMSGGERQRIALARAMLLKPQLLILDEATSALDLENEKRIRDTLKKLQGDMTLVVIGHRLPTLRDADQVVVMNKGQVVSTGTWDEVRKNATRYLEPMDENQ